ncbi:hypothetical protein DH2020_004540 [Rehmannia glutinosa]|uniref:Uncharacterized protein n=1 Tax=Rehmannia glutinosa TaxID=99300 RepID=A0ABR0XQF5_REHGL
MAALHYAADTTTSLHRRYHRFTSEPLNSRNPILLEIQESEKLENSEAEIEDVQKFDELREVGVSVPAGVSLDGSVAKNPILKYGLWLVGAFVFQTVCAIWVFNSADIDNKNQILNGTEEGSVLEVGGNGKGISRVGMENGAIDSIVYVDELEMERKIEEIRVMARETREIERLGSKKNGLDGEEMDGGIYLKTGIEEEVDDRLVMLRKKLKQTRGKMPVASVGYLKKPNEIKDGVEKGGLDERESDRALFFKKKYKFKGMSGNPIEKPKGFVGSDDTRFKSGNGDNEQTELSDVDRRASEEEKKKGMSEITESFKNTTKKVAKERGTSKQGKGKGLAKPKVIDGRPANEAVKSKKLNAEAVKSRKSSTMDIAVASDDLSKGNDSLEGNRVEDATSALKSKSGNDFWWSNLPYVLVIVMRRGHDGEGGEGLYTLKTISSTEDPISHMVAFEDRTDATNFCYLLQSFFEDLPGFNADVVPLTVNELNEAVKSYAMRVVVVKRGQLQLYAGQPLADAETSLRAMIKQG